MYQPVQQVATVSEVEKTVVLVVQAMAAPVVVLPAMFVPVLRAVEQVSGHLAAVYL
jgi:hypothetical protein